MKNNYLRVSVLLFAWTLAACATPPMSAPMPMPEGAHGHDVESHTGADAHSTESEQREGGELLEGAREIVIVANEWAFEPASIHLRAGEPVNIVLVNEGLIEHEVEFADIGLHLHAQPGETVMAGLVPTTAGEFEFGCHLPGHYEVGIFGELHIEGA